MISSSDSEPQVRDTMAGEESGTSITHGPSKLVHHCSSPAAAAMCKGRPTVVRAGNLYFEVNHPI